MLFDIQLYDGRLLTEIQLGPETHLGVLLVAGLLHRLTWFQRATTVFVSRNSMA